LTQLNYCELELPFILTAVRITEFGGVACGSSAAEGLGLDCGYACPVHRRNRDHLFGVLPLAIEGMTFDAVVDWIAFTTGHIANQKNRRGGHPADPTKPGERVEIIAHTVFPISGNSALIESIPFGRLRRLSPRCKDKCWTVSQKGKEPSPEMKRRPPVRTIPRHSSPKILS
jgi:hypothetical protein